MIDPNDHECYDGRSPEPQRARNKDMIRHVSVDSIMREVDDAIDERAVSRDDAMKFLQSMLLQIELRMGWVRDAIREQHK
jgi:hypothetical protein